MGMVYSEITLSNASDGSIKPMKVKCLVDTGSTYLCVPEHIFIQLKLRTLEEREVTLANGHKEMLKYAGPVQVNFEDRNCFVGTLVTGDEVLLGAVPMEDMDLIVHPKLLKLSVNPDNPNIAHGFLK